MYVRFAIFPFGVDLNAPCHSVWCLFFTIHVFACIYICMCMCVPVWFICLHVQESERSFVCLDTLHKSFVTACVRAGGTKHNGGNSSAVNCEAWQRCRRWDAFRVYHAFHISIYGLAKILLPSIFKSEAFNTDRMSCVKFQIKRNRSSAKQNKKELEKRKMSHTKNTFNFFSFSGRLHMGCYGYNIIQLVWLCYEVTGGK